MHGSNHLITEPIKTYDYNIILKKEKRKKKGKESGVRKKVDKLNPFFITISNQTPFESLSTNHRERERERELTSSEKVVEVAKTSGKPWEKKKEQRGGNGSY